MTEQAGYVPTAAERERGFRFVKPRDLRPGDRVSRSVGTGWNLRYVYCTVLEVRKVNGGPAFNNRTVYYIRVERPEGVGPNDMADHFGEYPSRNLRVEVTA